VKERINNSNRPHQGKIDLKIAIALIKKQQVHKKLRLKDKSGPMKSMPY
jgi:hypothetical protein